MNKYPKLIPFKVGTSEFVTCEKHGTFAAAGLTEDGTCSKCDRLCRGCGEIKDSVALESAAYAAGYSSGHEKCLEKTEGFWMEKRVCAHVCTSNCRREGCNCKCGEFHEPEETDAMLEAKEKKFI